MFTHTNCVLIQHNVHDIHYYAVHTGKKNMQKKEKCNKTQKASDVLYSIRNTSQCWTSRPHTADTWTPLPPQPHPHIQTCCLAMLLLSCVHTHSRSGGLPVVFLSIYSQQATFTEVMGDKVALLNFPFHPHPSHCIIKNQNYHSESLFNRPSAQEMHSCLISILSVLTTNYKLQLVIGCRGCIASLCIELFLANNLFLDAFHNSGHKYYEKTQHLTDQRIKRYQLIEKTLSCSTKILLL